MNVVQVFLQTFDFHRVRTLGILESIAKLPDPTAALRWRPAATRAHIGWQLIHIAITEEIFATERLAPARPVKFAELWPRFRGGSTPDEQVPSVEEIRQTLAVARQDLIETLSDYGDDRLGEIPPALAARKYTVRDVLSLIVWHEAHHQGQAHITLNLFKQAHGQALA